MAYQTILVDACVHTEVDVEVEIVVDDVQEWFERNGFDHGAAEQAGQRAIDTLMRIESLLDDPTDRADVQETRAVIRQMMTCLLVEPGRDRDRASEFLKPVPWAQLPGLGAS